MLLVKLGLYELTAIGRLKINLTITIIVLVNLL